MSIFRIMWNIPLTFDVNLLREFFGIPNATTKRLHEPPFMLLTQLISINNIRIFQAVNLLCSI